MGRDMHRDRLGRELRWRWRRRGLREHRSRRREEVVEAVEHQQNADRGNDLPALRKAAMLIFVDDGKLRCAVGIGSTGNLRLEALDALRGVEAKIIGIGTN